MTLKELGCELIDTLWNVNLFVRILDTQFQ